MKRWRILLCLILAVLTMRLSKSALAQGAAAWRPDGQEIAFTTMRDRLVSPYFADAPSSPTVVQLQEGRVDSAEIRWTAPLLTALMLAAMTDRLRRFPHHN